MVRRRKPWRLLRVHVDIIQRNVLVRLSKELWMKRSSNAAGFGNRKLGLKSTGNVLLIRGFFKCGDEDRILLRKVAGGGGLRLER